jgi:DNA-binding SARP family transcriptional activator/tRNA A-37 threonylcarbamoyl transferase component Bud32/energy-coupling factor transporter ATP-binding protein EcfA2
MRFRVLGPLAVQRDGEPVAVGGPQQRRLLALLIIERPSPVSVDRIVDVLWPDDDAPDGAPRSVKTYVSRLRAALGPGCVVTDAAGYRLDGDGSTCDADDFERLVAEASRALPDRAVPLYEEALGLWRGPALGEFASEWWALPESTRLGELATVARERWAEAMIVMGRGDQAIPDLERLAHSEPFRERPVALLMQALHATGRQADALRAFSDHRTRLAGETGLDPSADLVELERSILASDHGAPGTALRGYVIRAPIGEGAFGRVYEATQPGTERRVAVKAIRPDLADSTDFIRRFESEARLVARLEHPHIVPLYDFWREPGGAYLVFRLLTGGSARTSVVTGGPWSLPRVDRLLEEIGAALIHAHAAGVQHNDVRSANVLLDDEGAAYLTDFGIADFAGSGRAEPDDIRSFAWMIWGLLVGDPEPDAVGRTPSLIGPVPDIPTDVDGVLVHATDPALGFGSVAELVLAWRVALGHAEGARRPVTSDERLRAGSLRRAAARQLEREVASGRNPYRGLEAFDDVDEHVFFGRTSAVAALTAEVDRHPFVLVVGASGSGKSSLVRAGLIPQLRERGSIAVVTVPGDDPVRQLGDALDQVATAPWSGAADREPAATRVAAMARATGAPVVIVIDQIEELWTASSCERRTALIAELSGVVDDGHARVIATVRADMLDRPLQDPVMGPHVGAATFVVGPLTPAELDEAITLPAASVGVTVDGAVVAQLVAEASSHPGSLPMLQFTLTELYDRRVDGRIDFAALESLGGLGGAIGRRAEAVLAEIGSDRLDPARELFGRLVTPGIGGPDTRRRARVGELSTGARTVADAFVAARLLVIDRDEQTREPTVEIAHEALLGRWARLADWIEEDRQWLRQLQQLATAAAAWEERGRSDADLYRGARLEAAVEALEVDGRPATALERAFVEAGRSARDSEIRQAQRTARQLRRLLAGTAAALVLVLLAGSVAAVQRRDAERAALAATAAERAGRIEGLVGRAESIRSTQRDVAALLAVEAHRLGDNARTRSALLGTFTEAPGLVVTHRLARPAVPGVGAVPLGGIVLPDGATAFVLDAEGRVTPFDLESGGEGTPWPAMSDEVAGSPAMLRASPDGRRLAQLSWVEADDGPVGVVAIADVDSRRWLFHPVELRSSHASASFSDDGDVLYVTLDPNGELVALDASSGARIGGLPGLEVPDNLRQAGAGVAVVSGGRVVVGDIAGRVRIVDGRSFEVVDEITVRAETTFSFRTADRGRAVVGTGVAGLVKIDVDVDAAEVAWSVIDGADACPNIAVLDEPGLVLCGDHFGRLVARDVASGVVRERLDPQRGNVGTIWPAEGQREVVTFGVHEPVVTRWRLDGGGAITRVLSPGWWAGEINPAATRLVVVPAPPEGEPGDGTMPDAKVIDLATGEDVIDLSGMGLGTWVTDTDFTVGVPDERGLVPLLLSTDTGTMQPFGEHIDGVPEHFEGSPGKDAFVLVTITGPRSLVEVRLADGRRGAVLDVEGFPHVAISRTGHRLAVGHESEVTLHDGASGELVGKIPTPAFRAPYLTIADQLFLASPTGELTQYDLATLEPVRTLGGSRGHIQKVDGTADGSLIAVKGGDRFVTLHDVETGLTLGGPIVIPDSDVNASPSMSLSTDGTALVYGGGRTSGAKVWDLRPERWHDAACGIAGRNLTRDEWRSHIGDLAPYRATCTQLPTEG